MEQCLLEHFSTLCDVHMIRPWKLHIITSDLPLIFDANGRVQRVLLALLKLEACFALGVQ